MYETANTPNLLLYFLCVFAGLVYERIGELPPGDKMLRFSGLNPNFGAFNLSTMPIHSKHIDRTKPVAYLQGDGNYTTLFYPNGTTSLTSNTLKKVSTWYPVMIRIRKGVAINPEYVVGYNRYSSKGLAVRLKFAGKTVTFEASRRCVASVEEAILVYKLPPYLQDYQIE